MDRRKRADNTLTVKAILIPVRYTKDDIKWMRKKYKPGQVLEIAKLKVDGEEICRPQRKKIHGGRYFSISRELCGSVWAQGKLRLF